MVELACLIALFRNEDKRSMVELACLIALFRIEAKRGMGLSWPV